jgi:4-hydroxybenzoate polyprenyltransferase
MQQRQAPLSSGGYVFASGVSLVLFATVFEAVVTTVGAIVNDIVNKKFDDDVNPTCCRPTLSGIFATNHGYLVQEVAYGRRT